MIVVFATPVEVSPRRSVLVWEGELTRNGAGILFESERGMIFVPWNNVRYLVEKPDDNQKQAADKGIG